MPRKRRIITFSMPPAMEEQLRHVAEEEGRTVSELLREGFRLYLEVREWHRRERTQMRRSHQTNRKRKGGATDE